MATIYKITNTLNNKCYIGKTTRPVKIRWEEHIRESKLGRVDIPLYNAFNKYGINNFSFEIVEDNISNDEINNKEKYYIQLFQSMSHANGYNVTEGGDGGKVFSKLTQEDVNKIIVELSDQSSLLSMDEIGKKYNISKDVIGSINRGESWVNPSLSYPIRKYDTTGLTINKEKYQNIINDIKNTTLLLKDIAKKYDISEGQLTQINNGKYCYNGTNKYYEGIYNGPFPIRETNKQKMTDADQFVAIFYDVLFTNNSMAVIGEKFGMKGNTIQYIISGKRRKELTKDYVVPLRKNIETNKQIFMKLHPQFQGGD